MTAFYTGGEQGKYNLIRDKEDKRISEASLSKHHYKQFLLIAEGNPCKWLSQKIQPAFFLPKNRRVIGLQTFVQKHAVTVITGHRH
jgi:hypothetical protein